MVCVCVCVYTSMTDIVEKWIEYSQLTWLEHLFTRTSKFWWYEIRLSIWIELCVTSPSGKRWINSTFDSRIFKSSFVRAATRNLLPFSCIYTRTQNSMGQKWGGNSAWNRKGFSSLSPLDHPTKYQNHSGWIIKIKKIKDPNIHSSTLPLFLLPTDLSLYPLIHTNLPMKN